MPSTFNSSMSLQTTPFNPTNYAQQGGERYNLAADLATSVNEQLMSGYSMGMSELLKSGNVGIFNTTKIDSFELGRYLQFLPDFATKNGLLPTAIDMAKGNNLFDLGKLSGIGPKLEYIPVDNKDGLRKFGYLMFDNDNRQNQFRIRLDAESIVKTETLNGTNEGLISSGVTEIYLSANNSYINDLKGGCVSCAPNSCGRGYRQLFVIKNQNSLLGGTFPQNGFTASETVIVLDVKDPGDGGLILVVKRGANGKTITDPTTGITFNATAIDIEEGDFLLVGTVTPTTECLPTNLKCQYIQPKRYTYCSSIKEFEDCVACVSKTQFMTQQSWEIMTPKEKLANSILQNLKTFYQRAYNEFVWSDQNYAQLQPAPAHPNPAIDFGKGDNGELIPRGIRGILKQFDAYARELEITFTSCEQSCWEYSLTTLIEALEAGQEGNQYTAPYTDAGWLMVGDIEGIDGIFKARLANFLPLTQESMNQRQAAIGLTYSVNPTSLFAADSNNPQAKTLNNEFNRMGSDYGIKMGQLQIGRYTFRALHDRALANLEPGVIRLMYMPDVTFFTDNQDATMEGIFGGVGSNPFLPASATVGRLTPNIVSYNTATAWVNGRLKNVSPYDCGMSWMAYMRAGVHLKPANLPKSLKISLNALKANPTFPGVGQEAFIKTSIWDLDCDCMSAKKRVEVELDTWANGSIINGPVF